MPERKEYVMTDEQLEKLLDASKPTMCIMIGGVPNPTPQENSNRAWQFLAKEVGFVWDTVEPVSGKDHRHFTAMPRGNDA